MRKTVLALFAISIWFAPEASFAGGCGCVPISLPVGEQFLSHRPGALRVGYSMIYSDTNHYYIGTERQDGPGQTEETVAPSTLGLDNTIGIVYDAAHSLSFGIEIPIVHTEQAREFGGVKGSMDASGLGDVRVLGNWWFKNDPNGAAMHIGAGLRLPTGTSDKSFRAQNGTDVTQDLAAQAGTGNLAGIVEFGGSTFFGQRWGVAFSTRYTFAPANTTVANFRNELTGGGWEKNSDADQVTGRVSLATPLSTGDGAMNRVAVRANVDLAWIPYDDLFGDSEGFRRAGVIFAAGPGLSYTPTPAVTLSADVPLTLYRDVQRNGGNVQEWTLMIGATYDGFSF
jgi:hypothetical protein